MRRPAATAAHDALAVALALSCASAVILDGSSSRSAGRRMPGPIDGAILEGGPGASSPRPAAKEPTAAARDTCKDFPAWHGEAYVSSEGDLTCRSYCGARICDNTSYTSVSNDTGTSLYRNGNTLMYYTLNNMLKSPFKLELEERWANNKSMVGRSGAELPMIGMHWFPWDSSPVQRLLDNAGITEKIPTVLLSLFDKVRTPGKLPNASVVKACKLAGDILGTDTFLREVVSGRCSSVPDVVKSEESNLNERLSPAGKAARELWEQKCAKDENTHFWVFECYAGSHQVTLFDANFGNGGRQVTPRFNLPMEVACCCCGGGTTKNKEGSSMTFVIDKQMVNLAAKLTVPEGNLPTNVSDETEVLHYYPKFTPEVKLRSNDRGLDYQFPTARAQEVVEDYPYGEGYGKGEGANCEDYRLQDDISSPAVQFAKYPQEWVDYSGASCRYFYYTKTCHDNDVDQVSQENAPLERYWNGMFTEEVVNTWNMSKVITEGMRAADAFKVCCACGGGRKKDGAKKPRRVFDTLNKSYYLANYRED